MKVYIVPYNLSSESAHQLSNRLGAKLSSGQKRFIKNKSFIINWGNSDPEILDNVLTKQRNIILNKPNSVALASNKIETFKCFSNYDVPTVEWTTDRDKATEWLDENGYVYARLYSRSSQGKGIQIITIEDSMPSASLYTKAITKAHEYRVHVFKGRILDYTKKRKRTDVEVNLYIKNFEHGWVFCRDNVSLPDKVESAALQACRALGLDFCALDILYREKENRVFVLEANTAPGLEGTTLDKYYQALKGVIECHQY